MLDARVKMCHVCQTTTGVSVLGAKHSKVVNKDTQQKPKKGGLAGLLNGNSVSRSCIGLMQMSHFTRLYTFIHETPRAC